MMGKDDFNKLNLKDQVEFINKNLGSKTLTEISKEIKISRSTIRERFLKQGYIFNKSQNKYIYSSYHILIRRLIIVCPSRVLRQPFITFQLIVADRPEIELTREGSR